MTRGARIVGVDVHLERAAIADDEQRVAEPLQLALERVGVERVALDEEGRAVAVARELLVDRVDACLLGVDGGRLRRLLARRRGDHAAQDLGEPCSARVDDPGLAEHVELLGCTHDGGVGALHERAQKLR